MKNKVGIIRKFLAAVVLLLVLVFFCACGLYYFERETQPEAFGSISDAIGYILLTLTTVGYGSIYPLTFGGKLVCILTAAVGSLISIACFIWIVFGTFRLGQILRKHW